MSRVIVTEGAAQGLERCRKFLAEKNPRASKRAAQVIKQHFFLLKENKNIGRPLHDFPELRELVIEFGDSGYVALYRKDELMNVIYILAFRHQRECGFING